MKLLPGVTLVVLGTCIVLYLQLLLWDEPAFQTYLKRVNWWDYNTTSSQSTSKKIRVLPPTVIAPTSWVSYKEQWCGLQLPVVTTVPTGRLGNVMGEYATLYALWGHYNVSAVVRSDMAKILGEVFTKMTLPDLPGVFEEAGWRSLGNVGPIFGDHKYNYAPIEVAAAGLMGPHRFLVTGYTIELQLFNPFKDDLRREFTFTKAIRNKVQDFFSEILNKTDRITSDPVFVGFHIRRTDYANHMKILFGGSLPGENYYNRALQYYRDKFSKGRVIFVASSDDIPFIKSSLSNHTDVFFTKGVSRGVDLAILTSCNHSIITLGSFGFWAGYLTGGEVVYPLVHLEKPYRFSQGMYEKVGLDNFTPLPID